MESARIPKKNMTNGLNEFKNIGNTQNILNNKEVYQKCEKDQAKCKRNIEPEALNKQLQIDTSQLNFNHDFFSSLVGRLNTSKDYLGQTGTLNSKMQSYDSSLC